MKKKEFDIFEANLDAEERDISESVDRLLEQGKLKNVSSFAEDLAFAQEAATNYLVKTF